jgi:hypothetical protein
MGSHVQLPKLPKESARSEAGNVHPWEGSARSESKLAALLLGIHEEALRSSNEDRLIEGSLKYQLGDRATVHLPLTPRSNSLAPGRSSLFDGPSLGKTASIDREVTCSFLANFSAILLQTCFASPAEALAITRDRHCRPARRANGSSGMKDLDRPQNSPSSKSSTDVQRYSRIICCF